MSLPGANFKPPQSHRHHQLVLVVLIVVACNLIHHTGLVHADDLYERPSVSAAEILRGRGYLADELFVESSSGYILRVTRGRNPLIDGGSLASKDPILFLHGSFNSANDFVINSAGAKPKDFTNMSLSNMNLEELIDRLAEEPSAKSLPMLAMNCGHEVWLLDRRGVPGSQQLIGDPKSIKATPSGEDNSLVGSITNYLTNLFSGPTFASQVVFALDQKFWNYSLDEQARDDFPKTIDFVLKNSPRASRVSVVGHSAGGAITLMALSLYSEELARKISSCVLWSPIYATGNDNPMFILIFSPVVPVLESFIGPVPPSFSTNPLQLSLMAACSSPLTWTTICEQFLDLQFGNSGGQQPAKPFIFASEYFGASSHEVAQIGQTGITYKTNKTMHAYNYGERGNQIAYGQSVPPLYDLSVLSNFSSLSFYSAKTDSLVTPADVQQARAQLRVPSKYQKIDTTFNHIGYFSHKDAPSLVIIPSMRDLETLAQ